MSLGPAASLLQSVPSAENSLADPVSDESGTQSRGPAPTILRRNPLSEIDQKDDQLLSKPEERQVFLNL